MTTNQILDRLTSLGFDRLTVDDAHKITVRCSQCDATVINAVACHEHHCPNQTFTCRGCDTPVRRRGAYCEDCR
jgi:hypothetical protein